MKYEITRTFVLDGRRYYVRAHTEREAAEKMAKKKMELEAGRVPVSRSMTVSAWAERWLASYIVPTVQPRTAADYRTRVRLILSKVGRRPLCEVRPVELQAIINGMEGSSRDYIAKVRRTLWQMFDAAEANGLTQSNPASRLKMPKAAEDGNGRAITDAERDLILRTAGKHPAGPWVLLMLFCGLRPGETARVKGCHFDFEAGTLYVDGTKTKKSKRTVPFPAQLRPLFEEVRPFDYAFRNARGGPLTKRNMATMWRSFVRAMNIEAGCRVYRNRVMPPYAVAGDLVPYCLRHTFGTDAVQGAGVPLQTVAEWMGHTSIQTTMRYVHHDDAAFRAGAEQLAKHRDVALSVALEAKRLEK